MEICNIEHLIIFIKNSYRELIQTFKIKPQLKNGIHRINYLIIPYSVERKCQFYGILKDCRK